MGRKAVRGWHLDCGKNGTLVHGKPSGPQEGCTVTKEEIAMARIKGVEPHEAGLFTRFVYWLVRRKVGAIAGHPRVVEPVKITAHHPRLLRAYGDMERGQEAATSVPTRLKTLASIQTSMLVGCPF
jgi:hypothetical protein